MQNVVTGIDLPGRHSQVRWYTAPAAVMLLLLGLLLPRSVHAQEENRAGLIVVYGDGRVAQQCVRFAEESISGYELLTRSGLPASIEVSAIGPTVCSIDGEGCAYPQESCFCRCQGSPCVYWSYWRQQEDGSWRYQTLGAGNVRVRNGDVEGWRWAAGTARDAEAPPPASLAAICGSEGAPAAAGTQPIASVTAPVTAPVTATVTVPDAATVPEPGTTAMRDEVTSAGTSAVVTSAATAAVAEQAEASNRQGLLLLLSGVIVLPAAVLVLWALMRKGT